MPIFGCKATLSFICCLKSGEALNKNQFSPSLTETAIDDCVLGFALFGFFLACEEFEQLQFHCGKPPPAADPNTKTFIVIVTSEGLRLID